MSTTPMSARTRMLASATTTGSTGAVLSASGVKTYQATAVASTGTGNAVIDIQGTLDGTYFDTIGTITISSASTAGASDSFTSDDRYFKVRASVTSLSSNITADAWMGY